MGELWWKGHFSSMGSLSVWLGMLRRRLCLCCQNLSLEELGTGWLKDGRGLGRGEGEFKNSGALIRAGVGTRGGGWA